MPTLNISPKFESHVDRRPRLEKLRSLLGSRAASNSLAGGVATTSAAALGMAFIVVVANTFNASLAPRREASGTEVPMRSAQNRIDSSPTGAIGFGASLAPRREQVGTEAPANSGNTAIPASSPSTDPGSVAGGRMAPDRIDSTPTGAIDRLYLSNASQGPKHSD